jgi:8-oxo-dGTP pyrophosphatase MutT (NUDIX family)
MRERLTARVVLLDAEGRILLLKGRLPSAPDGPSFWYTVGGGVEPGESLMEGAAREIVEETGLADAALGPVLWRDEVVLSDVEGETRLFRQHYILARTAGGPLSRAGWQSYEHDLTDDARWWTLAELRQTAETVYPEGLADLLADVLAGRLPPEPLLLIRPG